jgi:hypothetical protein
MLLGTAILLAAAALSTSPMGGGAIAQTASETMTLNGHLANGTADAAFEPGSVPVTLRILEGVVELVVRTVTPVLNGAFQFEEVPLNPQYIYFFTAEYQGAIYSAVFTVEELSALLNLTVYEASTSVDVLVIDSYTIIVTGADLDAGVVEILERASVFNPTDRTVVPNLTSDGMPDFLRFALPTGAHNLDVRSDLVGGDVLEVDLGFAVTTPVPPSGDSPYLFEFLYRAPYSGGTLDLSRTLRFGAESVRVVVPADVALGSSPQLDDLGTAPVNDKDLQLLEGISFSAGARLELTLSGLPQSSLVRQLGGWAAHWYMAAGVPVLVALVLGALLVVGLTRRTRIGVATLGSGTVQATRDVLLRRLAELDSKAESNAVPRRRYLAERGEMKRYLMEIEMQQYLETQNAKKETS